MGGSALVPADSRLMHRLRAHAFSNRGFFAMRCRRRAIGAGKAGRDSSGRWGVERVMCSVQWSVVSWQKAFSHARPCSCSDARGIRVRLRMRCSPLGLPAQRLTSTCCTVSTARVGYLTGAAKGCWTCWLAWVERKESAAEVGLYGNFGKGCGLGKEADADAHH